MKKRVILMAGIMAVALAGVAQAGTTMFAVQNASAVEKFVVQDDGKVGIGTATPGGGSLHVVATDVALFADSLTNNQPAGMGVDISTSTGVPPLSTLPIQGANYTFLVKYNNGGAGIPNNFNVFRMIARTDTTVAENFTGQFAAANFAAQHGGSGTASLVIGFIANVNLRTTGSVTEGIAIDAASPSRAGGATGTFTNAKGVRIRSQKVTGVTNAYAISQEGVNDINSFAGAMSVPNLQQFSDNTTATVPVGTLYRTPAGVVMVKF